MLIRDAKPLRLHDLGDDPRSVGFPAHHPPMRSFLGVPILLRGVAYGNLYLTEKVGGGDFTDEDEELTQLLAAQAAVAIENTRLYETSTRWLRHFESMNEIGDALASELELEPLLGLVARQDPESDPARDSFSSHYPKPAPTALSIGAADGEGSDAYGLGRNRSSSSEARRRAGYFSGGGASGSTPSSTIPRSTNRPLAGWASGPRSTFRSSCEGGRWAWSSPTTSWVRPRASPTTTSGSPSRSRRARRLRSTFLERVSRDAVRRVVEAQELERARLARELHDETGQALTSILLGLKSLEESVDR